MWEVVIECALCFNACMKPDHLLLPVDFLRPTDCKLLCSLGLFADQVVRTGLWEQSKKAIYDVVTKDFLGGTVVVTFVRWPGTPLILEIRESGFYQTTLGRIAIRDGLRRAAAEEVGASK